MDDDEEPMTLFKRFEAIPCFRTSFMTGISSGLGIGLAYFLYSNNPANVPKIALGSYVGVTLATWTYCRWQYAQKAVTRDNWQKFMQHKFATEGTEQLGDEASEDVKSV